MSFEEGGERFSSYFLQARTKDDLQTRFETHRRIADSTYGMMGRSPDHVASFVTGMAAKPGAFRGYADNIVKYYERMRREDIYAAYAVAPPQGTRDPALYQQKNLKIPTLRVVSEDDHGVIVSGVKMLATGAVLANEIWIGNLIPLAADQLDQAITCAVPVNSRGLSLWSRKPLERHIVNEIDSPLTARFDETDSVVVCDRIRVPWERVFVHNDAILARSVYLETPGHCYGNHQSNVRYWSKLQLIVGLAAKVTAATGADQVPATREALGRLAGLEALLGGLIQGQIHAAEAWPEGFVTFNRRYMYAALAWCTENYSAIIDTLREMCGGGFFQLPADTSVLDNPELAETFQTYWTTARMSAMDRMKLYKLAWDVVGSEFAGRHQQYEKFYAGNSLIVRNYSYMMAPWEHFGAVVDNLIGKDKKSIGGDK
jgi:4-hydroxyphenylacetate 3-monooxygenase